MILCDEITGCLGVGHKPIEGMIAATSWKKRGPFIPSDMHCHSEHHCFVLAPCPHMWARAFLVALALLSTTRSEHLPFVVIGVVVDQVNYPVIFQDPRHESVYDVVTRFAEEHRLDTTARTMIRIEAHRKIAKKLETQLQRAAKGAKNVIPAPTARIRALPSYRYEYPVRNKSFPFAVNMFEPVNFGCSSDPSGTLAIEFELGVHEGDSPPEFPREPIEACIQIYASGLRNTTVCRDYMHGEQNRLDGVDIGQGPMLLWCSFRLKSTKDTIAHSPPFNVLIQSDCSVSSRTPNASVPQFVEGYCEPNLACPEALPVAFLGSPRSGSTMMKRMIAEQLEQKKFYSHGYPKIRCCNDLHADPVADRLPIFVARNPYSRLASSFFHGYVNPFLVPEEDDGLYLQLHGSFGAEWLPKFEKWLRFTLDVFPTDDVDSTNHIKSQVGHFHSPLLRAPHNISRFHILHLETIQEDWGELEQELCQKYGTTVGCVSLCTPLAGGKRKSRPHDLSPLASRPDLLKLIQDRYAADFTAFGYSTDVNQLLPLKYGPTGKRRTRVDAKITLAELCDAQVPFVGSACTEFRKAYN